MNVTSHFILMSDLNKYCISANNISKSFRGKHVLQNLSLSIKHGNIFGLVGLNGAGKTTLIRILLGLLGTDLGKCSVLGMNPADNKKKFYQQTGVVLEHNGFYGNLTVLENLTFFAQAHGVSKKELHNYFEEYWRNTDIGKENKKVKYFSRGQKMQCALCRAFLGWPQLYFFDEPVVALDMEAYEQFCDMVRFAHSLGATILISSHQLETIEELCTSVGILENNTINVLEKNTDNIRVEHWYIKTDNSDRVASVIQEETGEIAQYQNDKWHFIISRKSNKIIADIVSQLVAESLPIYEVAMEKESFRKSINQYYNNRNYNINKL